MYNEQTSHHLLDQEVTGNPSWVAFTADNLLYSVDENSDITGVAALDLNGEYYNPIAEQHGSSGVVHLEFNADATRMVGSAYGQGTIDVWDTTDGGLTLIKTIVSDGELGPGQESPHPHQALLDPTGRFFLVNDLGTNSILLIDTKDDAYEVVDNIPTQSGCGPRHAVFYPSFESELHYYILPSATSAAGEIILIADKDLYVSSRNTEEATDNIAHFPVIRNDDDHTMITLEYEGKTSTGGISPRMFSCTNDFGTIFVGNQKGPLGIVVLSWTAQTGVLKEEPVTSISMADLGVEDGDGPQFVKMVGGGTGGGV